MLLAHTQSGGRRLAPLKAEKSGGVWGDGGSILISGRKRKLREKGAKTVALKEEMGRGHLGSLAEK